MGIPGKKRFLPAVFLIFATGFSIVASAETDPAQILRNAPTPLDYPHAGSAVMLDESNAVVKEDGTLTVTSHQIIKVFNLRGRGRGEVRLPYNSSYENLRVDLARTIRKDGTVRQVQADAIKDQTLVPGYELYDNIRAKSFSMPGLEDDCIIEYQWTVERRKAVMPGKYWEEWRTQDYDPVINSRLSVTLPAAMSPRASYHNLAIKPVVTSSGKGASKTWVWEVKNSPAVETEPLMPPFREVASWFGVSTVNSWDEIHRWMWKLFEPRFKADWDIEMAVKRLTLGKESREEKAKAIFYWVESNIKHVELEPGLSGFQPHAAAEIYRHRYGDSKDMAVLLVSMLRQAGIEAFPALIHTAEVADLDKSLSHPAQFNHCIALAEVNGKEVWLDPTAEGVRFGDLPAADRGSEAFIIRGKKGEFRKTPAYARDENGVFINNSVALADDGTLEGSVSKEMRGDDAIRIRVDYKYIKPDDMKEAFQKTISYLSMGARLQGYQVSDFRDAEQPLFTGFTFIVPEWANRTRQFMIFPATFFHDEGVWGPFSKPRRNYPMVYTERHTSVVTTSILLPLGFTVEELPENSSVETPFGRFDFSYRTKDDKILMEKRMEIWPARVPAAQYDAMKRIYDQLSQERKKQVVLRKTTLP